MFVVGCLVHFLLLSYATSRTPFVRVVFRTLIMKYSLLMLFGAWTGFVWPSIVKRGGP
jgi:hypothetical protein